MHRERWQRARGLFEQALEIATTERAEFLDRNCLEDPELRREVDSLLEADGAASGFLEAGLAPMPSLRPPLNGKSIGAYRLEEIIGEGGMSIVYRASRADDEYRQQVAIKVQVRGLGSEHLKQRFRSERQILAGLAHPHIARLLDGGTTDDGSPYVVMEYVEGLSITEYCDHHRLSIDARLELFRKVCDAVHYAHQNLIVHRDLKPSNILVIEGGLAQAVGFRHRQVARPGTWQRRPQDDGGMVAVDDPQLRQPGTGSGWSDHDRERRLLTRSLALPAAERPCPLLPHGPFGRRSRAFSAGGRATACQYRSVRTRANRPGRRSPERDAGTGQRRPRPASGRSATPLAGRPRHDHRQGDAQEAGTSLRLCGRPGRGSAPPPGRPAGDRAARQLCLSRAASSCAAICSR